MSQNDESGKCVDTDAYLCPSSWLDDPAAASLVLTSLDDLLTTTTLTTTETPSPVVSKADKVLPAAAAAATASEAAGDEEPTAVGEGPNLLTLVTSGEAQVALSHVLEEAHKIPTAVIACVLAAVVLCVVCVTMCFTIRCEREKLRRQFQAEMAIKFETEKERMKAAEKEKAAESARALQEIITESSAVADSV